MWPSSSSSVTLTYVSLNIFTIYLIFLLYFRMANVINVSFIVLDVLSFLYMFTYFDKGAGTKYLTCKCALDCLGTPKLENEIRSCVLKSLETRY